MPGKTLGETPTEAPQTGTFDVLRSKDRAPRKGGNRGDDGQAGLPSLSEGPLAPRGSRMREGTLLPVGSHPAPFLKKPLKGIAHGREDPQSRVSAGWSEQRSPATQGSARRGEIGFHPPPPPPGRPARHAPPTPSSPAPCPPRSPPPAPSMIVGVASTGLTNGREGRGLRRLWGPLSSGLGVGLCLRKQKPHQGASLTQ